MCDASGAGQARSQPVNADIRVGADTDDAFLDGPQFSVLPYEVVRAAQDPDSVVLSFLHSTCEAAANLGGWDRAALEWQPPSARRRSAS